MIERQFINYLLNTSDSEIVTNNGIDLTYFSIYSKEYNFIQDYLKNYGKICTKATFISKFSEWEFDNEVETPEYLINALEEEKVYTQSLPIVKQFSDMLTNGDSREAIMFIREKLSVLAGKTSISATNLYETGNERLNNYILRAENPKSYFITTGFSELDEKIGGWDKHEEFALIAARTNQGKSWWLEKFGIAAAEQGIVVGLASGEMSIEKVGVRFDTLLGNISNYKIAKGYADISDDYKNHTKNLDKTKQLWVGTPETLGGTLTIPRLRAFIERYGIEMLLIDQYSLIKDISGAKQRNDKYEAISAGLKDLQTEIKIPIIMAAQLNRTAAGKDAPEDADTDAIAGSDKLAQDATCILSLKQKENGVIVIRIMKARECQVGEKLMYSWKIDEGKFEFIPCEDDALRGTKCEKVRKEFNEEEEPF